MLYSIDQVTAGAIYVGVIEGSIWECLDWAREEEMKVGRC
jgi:hypothetical protein